jgi:hypothetical protein
MKTKGGREGIFIVQVNCKKDDKGALHHAAVRGDISLMKAILQFNPDVNIQVRESVCALGNLFHPFPPLF